MALLAACLSRPRPGKHACPIEFFEDDQGRQPAGEWLRSLESAKRAAAIAAIETHLTDMRQDACDTEHGKHLGKGLFEFRVRHDESVIRGKQRA